MMLCCYRMYCDRRRTISDACYFCLTVMERAAGDRAKAAVKYNINKKVLDKIGELTANKGGKEARKIRGALDEYTMAERTWLENVMKMLIRRAVEAAYDSYESNAKQRRIGLNDLPPL
jgi:hypothetical protein